MRYEVVGYWYITEGKWFVAGVCLALAAAVVVITSSRSRRRRFWVWSRSRPGRLWEWLGFGKTGKKAGLDLFQFFVALSIPFAVVGIGAYFTASQAQDTALQSYLDGMAKLVIDNDLANSEEGDEVRTLARAQTLTVLASLDPQHKRSVVEFLYSSNLIGENGAKTPVITLTQADLSDADLYRADLRGAALMGADLRGAALMGADLSNADLSGANLQEANLSCANLQDANLTGARLSRANLTGTSLIGADLTDARLYEGADLQAPSQPPPDSGCSQEQVVTQEQLNQAWGDETTVLPEYLERPEWWSVGEEKKAKMETMKEREMETKKEKSKGK